MTRHRSYEVGTNSTSTACFAERDAGSPFRAAI